jgi:hypothetical protein
MRFWFGIRHLRYVWNLWLVNQWYDDWGRLGYHAGHRHYDDERLDRIWRGEA